MQVDITIIIILWATPSAAGLRPLHSRVADSQHCCKLIFAFAGTPTCHLCIFVFFFWDTTEHNNGHFGSRPGFLVFFVDFVAHGCYLVCLVPLLWRPGGAWDDPGTILGRSWDIGGHTEGPCEVQAVRYRCGFSICGCYLGHDFYYFGCPKPIV